MQALILVGGEATRLRPLTSTVPKPVVTLVDRPFMAYMLEWLAGHGIDRIVFSLGYLPDAVRAGLGDGSNYGLELTYVEEEEPLGTGGAVRHAEELLDERFVMLNGDVLTDLDLSAQIAQHKRTGARATLALVPVEDPSAYGLVRLREDSTVAGFLEKPKPEEIDTDLISAGAYVLEREALGLLAESGPSSIERDLFPHLVDDGLHGYRDERYWLDIGTPERYLQATFDILERRVETAAGAALDAAGVRLAAGATVAGSVTGPAVIEAGCRVDAGARVGPLAVLGSAVEVGEGAVVERAVVLDGAFVGPRAIVRDAIVAPGARVGADAEVSGSSVLGEGVVVADGSVVTDGARIFPD